MSHFCNSSLHELVSFAPAGGSHTEREITDPNFDGGEEKQSLDLFVNYGWFDTDTGHSTGHGVGTTEVWFSSRWRGLCRRICWHRGRVAFPVMVESSTAQPVVDNENRPGPLMVLGGPWRTRNAIGLARVFDEHVFGGPEDKPAHLLCGATLEGA